MEKKILAAMLSFLLAFLFSVTSLTPFVTGRVDSGNKNTENASDQKVQPTSAKTLADTKETEITAAKQLDIGNHIENGSFNSGVDGFKTSGGTNNYSLLTDSNGNLYAAVTIDAANRTFTCNQTSLKANITYSFSFDYYITSDNPNKYVYGLSTVAGHPGTGQTITPSGTAPYTIKNLATNTVILSNSGNTSMVRYGSGARTLAVDGANRTATADVGGWMRFSSTFTLASDAPSVYFYFMSFEDGKKADGVTPMTFMVNKKICFDNVTIKGLYNVSVSAGEGGKAQMSIIDTTPYTGKVYESGRVTYTATPSYRNEFAGWADDDGKIVSTDLTYTARPNSNTHLTATFTHHNGVNTYGAEYGMTDEVIDSSTSATTAAVSNTSGITLLGNSHVKVSGSSTYRYFRYNQMTLEPNTDYTLSFYMCYTGTDVYFGLFRNTAGYLPDCGSVIQRANYNTTASLSLSELTTSGETPIFTSTLHSSDYYRPSTSSYTGKWVHYTMSFHSGSFAAADNILTASGPATAENPNTATSYYTTDYDGTAYFTIRYDGVPSLNSEILLDNVSLTKTSNITVQPATGGTISSSAFGGTISSSTQKTLQNGTYVTLTAAPNTGKGFVAWVDENNSPVSYDKSYTFCAKTSRTLKPIFDTGNKANNGDFEFGETGWSAYGETGSNADIDVLDAAGLEAGNIPLPPSGGSALKLSFNRTDGALGKRVQAYSTVTFPTECNKTYEVSVWLYSQYQNARLALYVPTANNPYQVDAVNDFTFADYGYNVGATQLAGTYQYLLNDLVKSKTGNTSFYTNPYRSVDSSGRQNGWTKVSMIFTTDNNANCLQNAAISLSAKTYSLDGVNYTAGSVYFADVSVKTYDTYSVTNNKLAGNATVNDKVVLSSTSGTALSGNTLALKADPYEGFLFDGWYKDGAANPFSGDQDLTVVYTGAVSYEAKYRYDTSVPNLFLNDFENLPNGTDLEDTGTNNLGVWKLLSNDTPIGDDLSWGNYTVTDGSSFGITPHSGTKMLTDYGRSNTSHRLLNVNVNTNYIFSFYWYQRAGASNAFCSAAITANNSYIKVGSATEYANSNLTPYFVAQNFTSIPSNGTWRKYNMTFNSGNNETLKLFLRYTAGTSSISDNLFLDDFSLLPVNTETNTGTVTSLSIANNTAPLNTTFKGISSTVYHCFTYMDDLYDRNYTDEMAEYEMDRIRDSGTKLVRTIFKSQFAWDDATGGWNWNSQRMQDVYHWAQELQDRGIDIALNAGWQLNYLFSGTAGMPEVPYLYANGDYSLACARYGEWITEAMQAFESHGCHNIKYLIVFTEPSYPYAGNLVGDDADEWSQAINALDTALTSAGIRDNYKLVGPNQGSINSGEGLLNYALQNCDDVIDIYSTHYYPRSTSIYNDVYGGLANTAFSSYRNVMTRNNSTKDFWADEYFSNADNSPTGQESPWAGTQTAVGMTSAMNNGVDSVISWQLLDQLWVDQTNTDPVGRFFDGIHKSGTAPSLLESAVPKSQYYALTLMSKYLGYQNGQVYTSATQAGSGLYISTVQLEDGSWTVMVANASQSNKKFVATFATAINQTLYRHLYDPNTIAPDARAKVIGADKVYNTVGTSFVDSIPSGGVAIYTGLDF